MVNCYDFNVKHKLYRNPGVLRSLKVAENHLGDWITNAMTDLGATKSLTHVYRGTLQVKYGKLQTRIRFYSLNF